MVVVVVVVVVVVLAVVRISRLPGNTYRYFYSYVATGCPFVSPLQDTRLPGAATWEENVPNSFILSLTTLTTFSLLMPLTSPSLHFLFCG